MANHRATHRIVAEDRNYIIYNYQHQGRKEIRMVNGESVMEHIYCVFYIMPVKHTV